MSSHKRKRKQKQTVDNPRGGAAVFFDASVPQSIRQHARSTPDVEICGVLIGEQSETSTRVTGAVRGDGAAQGGAHVTFTQEAWVNIHEEKDKHYPGQAIVGWYHSHPGFGVFLSDHDMFIHKNFFSNPGNLAWVYDPHSDEEGCFGWNEGQVQRLERFEIITTSDDQPGRRKEPKALLPLQKNTVTPRFPRHLKRIAALLVLLALLVGIFLGMRYAQSDDQNGSSTGSGTEQKGSDSSTENQPPGGSSTIPELNPENTDSQDEPTNEKTPPQDDGQSTENQPPDGSSPIPKPNPENTDSQDEATNEKTPPQDDGQNSAQEGEPR